MKYEKYDAGIMIRFNEGEKIRKKYSKNVVDTLFLMFIVLAISMIFMMILDVARVLIPLVIAAAIGVGFAEIQGDNGFEVSPSRNNIESVLKNRRNMELVYTVRYSSGWTRTVEKSISFEAPVEKVVQMDEKAFLIVVKTNKPSVSYA